MGIVDPPGSLEVKAEWRETGDVRSTGEDSCKHSSTTRRRESISTPTGASACGKAGETVACCRSGNSAVEIESELPNDHKLCR